MTVYNTTLLCFKKQNQSVFSGFGFPKQHTMRPATGVIFIALLLFTTCQADLQSAEPSFISILISSQGLDFVKNLLVTKAISSLTPLQLPQIKRAFKIPFLARVNVAFSSITIYRIDVPSSSVASGDTGLVIVASDTSCNLSMNWHYSFKSWLLPVDISDSGTAQVQVEGMEVGLTLGLENTEGSMKLSVKDCGCIVENITIKLDGGASWIYKGVVNALKDKIGSVVESTITKKLKEGVVKLDSFLEDLPKEIPVDETAALNVTFVNDPLLSNSSIGFDINGLFNRSNTTTLPERYQNFKQPVSCSNPAKMLGILLDEAVLNSASALYFNAQFMRWIVDKVPDQTLLNTAGWRFIVPRLYRKYPDDDMNMNISLSTPPVIKMSPNNVDAIIYADLIIDVLESEEVIPVVCISLEIHASGSVRIAGNNLTGIVKLNDFTMSLKWSKVGNLRMFLIQPVMWTLIETVFLPYANIHLARGFPLPIFHGFTLQNAEIIFSYSKITVCSDVAFEDFHYHNQLLFHS